MISAANTCIGCAHWNAYERDGDFAPCDEAATPERAPLVGLANVRMLVRGGPLLTHREHGCSSFKVLLPMLARMREADPELADLYGAAPAA